MNPTPQLYANSNASVFLLGAIINILPLIEWTSLADYGIKAFIGGIIWLVFKLIGDYLSLKLFSKKGNSDKLDKKDESSQ